MPIIEYHVVSVVMAIAHHEHIAALIDSSGLRWSVPRVIELIESKAALFFTVADGKRAYVGVNGSGTRRWVQTYADGQWSNNLLALPKLAA